MGRHPSIYAVHVKIAAKNESSFPITQTPHSFHPNPKKLSPKAQNLSRVPNPITRGIGDKKLCWLRCQATGHPGPGTWLIHPSPGRDKLCATLKPSAHSPKLGRAGRAQQTLQLPSAALPFLFGNPFLHTRAPETTQHAWSKSKQGGYEEACGYEWSPNAPTGATVPQTVAS